MATEKQIDYLKKLTEAPHANFVTVVVENVFGLPLQDKKDCAEALARGIAARIATIDFAALDNSQASAMIDAAKKYGALSVLATISQVPAAGMAGRYAQWDDANKARAFLSDLAGIDFVVRQRTNARNEIQYKIFGPVWTENDELCYDKWTASPEE